MTAGKSKQEVQASGVSNFSFAGRKHSDQDDLWKERFIWLTVVEGKKPIMVASMATTRQQARWLGAHTFKHTMKQRE